MAKQFTANYKKAGKWYIGWIEEIPGVNTQGKTLKEAKENLREALYLVLEANKLLARKDYGKGEILRESITLTS